MFPRWDGDLAFHQCSQTGPGLHSASSQFGYCGSFPQA